MDSNTINTNILGVSLSLKTDEDPAYLKKIIAYLESNIYKVQNELNVDDPLKAAILAGIFLSDEINKIEEKLYKDKDEESAKNKIIFQSIEKLNKILK